MTMRVRARLADELAMYFAEKGEILSPRSFDMEPDTPGTIKSQNVKKAFGSWSQMEQRIQRDYADLLNPQLCEAEVSMDPLEVLRASKVEK